MTSTVDAARRIQKQQTRFSTFHRCPTCKRILSIVEIIEWHCERCDAPRQPQEVREAA